MLFTVAVIEPDVGEVFLAGILDFGASAAEAADHDIFELYTCLLTL